MVNSDPLPSSNQNIERSLDAIARAVTGQSVAILGNFLMPIGTIYSNKTIATNPAILFGFGTWVALPGVVVVGKAAAGTFATAGSTGGEETHVLTVSEMPSHTHRNYIAGGGSAAHDCVGYTYDGATARPYTTTEATGGGVAHNNMPPYVVAYVWERTA